MPNRYLREIYIESERVNSISFQAEVLWTHLLVKVDDWGRCEASLKLLRPKLFPLRLDQVREADMQRWIAECEKAGLIRLYTVEGKQYLEMLKWEKGRAEKSKFPEPPQTFVNGRKHLHATENISPDSDNDNDYDNDPDNTPLIPQRGKVPAPKVAWTVSGGWEGITDELREEWAKAYPACDIQRQLNAAQAWLRANPLKAKKSNWHKFVTNWLSRSQDKGGDLFNGANNRGNHGGSRTEGTANDGVSYQLPNPSPGDWA